MPKDAFSHVTTWVFDLDNTLYAPQVDLFGQITPRMTDWVMEALDLPRDAANQLREDYWDRYGTTLTGLIDNHDIDPAPYLEHVHEISLDHIETDARLAEAIARLPGRRIVFTNATLDYAERVTQALGLRHVFDAFYGVEEAGLRPKPEYGAFERVFARDGLDPTKATMFEDDPRNLIVPHDLGMRTVHVAPQPHPEPLDHVQYHTSDIAAFLNELTR